MALDDKDEIDEIDLKRNEKLRAAFFEAERDLDPEITQRLA